MAAAHRVTLNSSYYQAFLQGFDPKSGEPVWASQQGPLHDAATVKKIKAWHQKAKLGGTELQVEVVAG